MLSHDKLISELANFIDSNGPWDLMITITFRKIEHSLGARRRFRQFLKYINTREVLFFENCIYGFVAFEKDSRGGVHIHALIRGIYPLYSEALEKRCRKSFGESIVQPYYPSRAGSLYLAKRYGTSYLEDYDFIKVNSRVRVQRRDGNIKRIQLIT